VRHPIAKYVKRLQSEIAYCYKCQARDSGESIWVQGDQIELESLMIDADVPERLRDDVAEHLSCLNCGTPLERGVDVGLRTQEEKAQAQRWAAWARRYAERVEDFGVLWVA
jgi:hypothetical protein